MKMNKNIIWSLVLLIIVAAVYRLIPGRMLGFAPQLAMAIFGASVVKDKKWAFALPLLSLFISDLGYQILYVNGLSDRAGFYEGQLINYALIALVTLFCFLMKRITVASILAFSLMAPTLYFLLSNFVTWAGGGGYQRPHNFPGMI